MDTEYQERITRAVESACEAIEDTVIKLNDRASDIFIVLERAAKNVEYKSR